MVRVSKDFVCRAGLILSVALGSAVLAFMAGTSFFERIERGWKGYRTIILPADERGADIEKRLSEAGFPVVSAATAKVEISNFAGFDVVPVSEIGRRLDDLDPRLDQYLRRVGGYFTTSRRGEPVRLAYVRWDRGPFALAGALRAALGGEVRSVGIPSLYLGNRILLIVTFIGFVLFARRITDERSADGRTAGTARHPASAIIALPWLLVVSRGWAAWFLVSGLSYLAWSSLLRECIGEMGRILNGRTFSGIPLRVRRAGTMALLSFAVSLSIWAIPGVSAPQVAAYGSAVLCSLAVMSGWGFFLVLKRTRQEHTLFYPVYITKTAGRKSVIPDLRSIAAVAVLSVIPAAACIVGEIVYPPLPQPASVTGISSFSWEDLERLSMANHVRELPDIADYLSHRAFQEGLRYGRAYGFPYRGEPVVITRYETSGGRIVARGETFLEFDDAWFDEVITGMRLEPLAAMLLSHGVPAGTRFEKPIEGPSPAVLIIMNFLTAFVILGYRIDLTAYGIYGMRSIALRRKRQTA